ncbi:hypothetical protein BCR33DRAFT_558102 [Rhizoclosmatium globosum]|uniref:Uncharacterized protein n=1 Tax=Rhizoclosmatium globosum TaxID=329046 RepID=A0A1Y2CSL5_9FUNG|nr:hypothetical protein BCR33DRAFT_558102 [Rhizoclosmatium globosum]|eukprot:ORY49991.1 hypothetical protein BCR33DRAFT_558102 [Rhizoclosmatium globosum]
MSTESVFAVLTLPIVFFIAGNGFLICANALSKVLPKLISIWSQKTKEPVLLLAILSVFNVSAMMNMILILPISVVALPVETCWSVNFAQNFTVLTYVVLFGNLNLL